MLCNFYYICAKLTIMIESLIGCRLFKGFELKQIEVLLQDANAHVKAYAQGDVIAIEGGKYSHLMIIAQGTVQAEKSDSAHRPIPVERISSPSLVAPTSLFAEEAVLPVSISARTEAVVVTIERGEFCLMMSRSITLMVNFMEIISNSNKFISEKVVYLTYKSIKSKYSNYLLNRMESEGATTFRNDLTQREMAEMFGVTRPALARAIGELVDDGAIYVKSKEIVLLYPEKLKQYARN